MRDNNRIIRGPIPTTPPWYNYEEVPSDLSPWEPITLRGGDIVAYDPRLPDLVETHAILIIEGVDANGHIDIMADAGGPDGNDITYEQVDGGVGAPLSVSVVGTDISVEYDDAAAPSASDVVAAVNAAAAGLVTATFTGTGASATSLLAQTNLHSGMPAGLPLVPYTMRYYDLLTHLNAGDYVAGSPPPTWAEDVSSINVVGGWIRLRVGALEHSLSTPTDPTGHDTYVIEHYPAQVISGVDYQESTAYDVVSILYSAASFVRLQSASSLHVSRLADVTENDVWVWSFTRNFNARRPEGTQHTRLWRNEAQLAQGGEAVGTTTLDRLRILGGLNYTRRFALYRGPV